MTDWVSTTCMRCAVGCGHLHRGVDVGYGLDTVRGNGAHPVNRGLACKRGVRETADPGGEWLTEPLVRVHGELESTTWDVAIARLVEEFSRVSGRDRDGVAVIGSGQQTNEAAYALGKLARGGLGTRYYDANTTLCMASAVTAYYDAFGSDAPPCTYDDVPEAESHVIWGANPAVAHPVMFRWIANSANDDGCQLLVVDPVRTKTADAADVHVGLEPGGDLDLARAVLARVVESGRVNRAFVEANTVGFAALRARLPDPESAAERAGVSAAAVERLAEALEHDTLLYWGMGVNQSVRGTATAGALIDLCLATGNLGPGTGPFSLTGQANSMGARVCSSKGTWPGHRDFTDPEARHAVSAAWDVPLSRLPRDAGPGPVGIFEAIETGPVEAVYAVATNPVAGMPDATTVAGRLDETFLVVQDAFHTETTELADVVLPAGTWGESDGTAMNMERTVSRVRPATDLPSGVRSDLDLITTIGNALVEGLFEADATPESVFAELAALTAGTPADCSGISYDRLAAETAVRWPAPDVETSAGYRYYHADSNGDGEWAVPTASGRARFSDCEGLRLPEPPDDDYPLTLTTAREPDGYNTGVRSRPVDDIPPVEARVHPDTIARSLDRSDEHAAARLETRRGAVCARIEPDSSIPEGLVWLPIHHPATNALTVSAVDPRSGEPNYKQCAVRLGPVEGPAPSAPAVEVAE